MNESDQERLRLRHLRFGWWSLAVFASAGVLLEALHGFKADWYLAVGMETRRLLWRLAHAHGTFLALVHVAFAWTARHARGRAALLASPCLIGAGIALPLGFFLGGVQLHGGDPGAGIVLLPLGAALLLVALVATALALRR